jgi:hypothetical protein
VESLESTTNRNCVKSLSLHAASTEAGASGAMYDGYSTNSAPLQSTRGVDNTHLARLLFELVGLTLRFIGLGSLFCHLDCVPQGHLAPEFIADQPRFW